jgi:N-acetylglucosaminyl-diphospho-decaprenol L-rhamnosyltransferase
MKPTIATQVDVVVVSYNSSEHLRGCIETIAASNRCNVFVVDNASTDGSLETIDDLAVTIVSEEQNRGFAGGCNLGWRLGKAPHVLFLNPDTRIDLEAIDALAAVLNDNEKVGVVGPRTLNSDGSVTLSQFRFPRVRSTFSKALYLHRLWPSSHWSSETVSEPSAYAQAREAEWLSGACLLVRRELLDRIGGFDETFFMYSEDTAMCRAAWLYGYSVRYDPSAVVVHFGGASASRAKLLPVLTRSRVLYVTMYYSARVALAHRIGFALNALTHALVGKGGWERRRGHMAAFRAALSAPSAVPAPPRDRGPNL